MKILAASCNRNGDARRNESAYIANIRLSSDAREHVGTGYGDDPNEALHKALSDAIAKFSQPLHDSIQVGIEVKF